MTNPFKDAVELLPEIEKNRQHFEGQDFTTLTLAELQTIITALSACRPLADETHMIVPADYRKTVLEEAARLCDESEAEAQRLRKISPDEIHKISRTSWVNTSVMLGQQIRALKTQSPTEEKPTDGFQASDFAGLHKFFMEAANDKVTSALLSNNYNVILAALKRCAT